MPLYTTIYTTYCILVSSDKFRKGQVKSMKINEQVKRLLESHMINSGIRNLLPEPMT
jgi:hypothetical protein